MKGTFHAASRRQRSKIIIHRHWYDCRNENPRWIGATRSLSMRRRMKGQNARWPCPQQTWAYQPEGYFKCQSPETNERRLDPRDTRIGLPMCGDRTPEGQGHRTWHPGQGPRALQDRGLHGIQDFMGFKTSWDLGLRGIQDFAGPRTSWDSRLRGTRDFMGSRILQKTGTLYASDQDLVLWCSLREHKLSR